MLEQLSTNARVTLQRIAAAEFQLAPRFWQWVQDLELDLEVRRQRAFVGMDPPAPLAMPVDTPEGLDFFNAICVHHGILMCLNAQDAEVDPEKRKVAAELATWFLQLDELTQPAGAEC